MAQAVPSPAEFIGEIARENGDHLILRDRGAETVEGLDALGIPEGEHYTDEFDAYTERADEGIAWLKSFDEIRVRGEDGSERVLQPFSEVVRICGLVDVEYGNTVTPRLQKMTSNEEHHVPTLNPNLIYASYVSLSAGGAVVLPTSVGNIVGAASPRGLDTMFSVKERLRSKSGVVLTTGDEIASLAEIPDDQDWEGYLRHMHDEGILVGSKLERNEDHPLLSSQPKWARDNSMQKDGTSMFVTLPGPYSDATARVLAQDNVLLTASSANISGQGNNRDVNRLAPQIKRGVDFVAWDPEAVSAYPLDEEHESQGVMVDFRPDDEGNPRFHIIRFGFMNGPFITESVAWMRENLTKPVQLTGDAVNVAHLDNQ